MEITSSITTTAFETLKPGDLFVFREDNISSFAMKTRLPAKGDQIGFVLLGPKFPYGLNEAVLVEWEPTTVISFGEGLSVLLPTDPSVWTFDRTDRDPVWLALYRDQPYICANCSRSQTYFHPCFVDFKTGNVTLERLPGFAAYTKTWEIAQLSPQHPPRTVVKYPLPLAT